MISEELKKYTHVEIVESYFDEINRDLFVHNPKIEIDKIPSLNIKLSGNISSPEEIYFYKIIELSYEEDFPRREAFENVISSINSNTFNFIYFLSGEKKGVSIFLGIVDNYKQKNILDTRNNFDVSEALINSFKGNFLGSNVRKLTADEINNEIFNKIKKSKRKSFFYGIPSEDENKFGEKNIFQGIDRLINSMKGETFQFVIVSEPIIKDEIDDILDDVYEYYNLIAPISEKDFSYNVNEGKSYTFSNNKSKSRSKSKSASKSSSTSDNYDDYSKTKGTSTSNSQSESSSDSESESTGTNKAEGKTTNIKIVQKKFKEQLEYLDEEYIPRLKLGRAKGLFKTAIYAMSKDNATLDKLEGNIKSIFQGNKTTLVPLREVRLFDSLKKGKIIHDKLSDLLLHFQIFPVKKIGNDIAYLLQNVHFSENYTELATYMTTEELSLIAGLPISEVPGISLNEAVDFGINTPVTEKGIELGNIIQRGIELEYNKVFLNKDILNKHIFISGVTGSGKTTTCQKILLETDFPFLVIEPAKTEYRKLYNFNKDIIFFTPGRNDLAPFIINPFELVKGENLSSHIDLLMATFQSVFPMEASMPYILKEAIINSYEKLGWDLENNINIYSENPWEGNELLWPTFTNVLNELTKVVEKKGFASELKQNYIGSLISRLSDLTIGTRGSILNVPVSINFEELIEKNVVIELDEIKSEEDKILLMGFILTRVSEIVKKKYKERSDDAFRHITLIEEAHRLLSKPDPGEFFKKQGVQTFTDMLAEIRKYGESLIIVDQIPNKLTPEIIKNTNTKIVHKLFADDDKSAIAHSIALNDKQKEFLSKLGVGEAVVFTEGWKKTVLIKVYARKYLQSNTIPEEKIKEIGNNYIKNNINIFYPLFSKIILTEKQVKFLQKNHKRNIKQISKLFRNFHNDNANGEVQKSKNKLIKIVEQYFEYFDENIIIDIIGKSIWELIKLSMVNEENYINLKEKCISHYSNYLRDIYYELEPDFENNLDKLRCIKEFPQRILKIT